MPLDQYEPDAASMPLGDHLEELRRRLILAALGLVPIVILALAFGSQILGFLIRPVTRALRDAGLNPELQATSPIETFASYVHIALVAAVLVGSPWVLYQAWRFVAPGLYAAERRFVYVLVPLSSVLTVIGVSFLYGVILPVVLSFFIGFGAGVGDRDPGRAAWPESVLVDGLPPTATIPILAGDPPDPEPGQEWINTRLMQRRVCIALQGGMPVIVGSPLTKAAGIAQQYRVREYVGLFLNLALAFAIGFQTPVVVLLLGWTGLVTKTMLVRYRRYIALGVVVLSAILTPADPISMVLLAVPLYLLFEFGMVLMVLLPAERIARGHVRPSVAPDERAAGRESPFAGFGLHEDDDATPAPPGTSFEGRDTPPDEFPGDDAPGAKS